MDGLQLKAVVLGAGKGTRLQAGENDAPKVMREACGKPLLWYVINALPIQSKEDIILVVGYGKEQVIEYFSGYNFAVQTQQLGTGHAVMAAGAQLEGFGGAVLVCYGDMPIVKRETYEDFIRAHFEQKNDCTILTGESDLEQPFGRIVRDSKGGFLCVVEEKDCDEEQLKITELNTGVYVFNTPLLLDALKHVRNNNAQSEYYLTDVPGILRENGAKVGLYERNLGDEILGVNTQEQLDLVEKIISKGL
ncbi:MAG: NTP transferase domain-containing protein [Oscillospiraceae bacterium]|nr:NTP transferase domain-containing protein [Oscillospiraceae bacterium]